ncbi:hypothetical protein [Agreia sp. VKM Ac-1783]|uniref:hypothetical protein n=1 Tax=Agreia sp. VKM Ac-1783 TaxID=1938889 RepID=UPI000A2AC165|nr:hypothetical protein [Agreia sp. VKM Ac-1783]SMQ71585.1 hypothetical protein SAMN06295943_2494 [Agreia sp. VKM Ac-1783]
MSFFGGNKNPLDDDGKKKDGRVSNSRLFVWIVVTAVALYLIGTGVYGIITKGS